MPLRLKCLSAAAFFIAALAPSVVTAQKPHAVFVVGTHHYSPQHTMPPLAAQLAKSGFKTTVLAAKGNPEKDPKGIPGLAILKDADVAVFYLRFLTLPDDQLKHITDYLRSGMPVVAFRTSSHAFTYPKDSKNADWNSGFGQRAMGTKYFVHLKGSTEITAVGTHPIFRGDKFKESRTARGSLYLSDIPDDATVLLRGTGKSRRTGEVKNAFGTHQLTATMTQDVAWTWRNEWGGRVFATTLGHPDTFKDPAFVEFFLSGIHWAADRQLPRRFVAKSINEMAIADAKKKRTDAKNIPTGNPDPEKDPALEKFAIYEATAPRPSKMEPIATTLPLQLQPNDRIALIGNTLFERSQWFGQFEAMLQAKHPNHKLVVRHLSWSADSVDQQPRPANFADTIQHLTHERINVIFAAFGYNESFAGDEGIDSFRNKLGDYVSELKSKSFDGQSAPRIILVSPTACENVAGVAAADVNNARIKNYIAVIREVARQQKVGFADVFEKTNKEMDSPGSDLTINGVHLNRKGDGVLSRELFRQTFGGDAPSISDKLTSSVVDKNRQFFRRFRPLNTFYYTRRT